MSVLYYDYTNLANRHTREYHPVVEKQEYYEMPSFSQVREAKDGKDGNATKDGYYIKMKYSLNWAGTGALAKSPATLRSSRFPGYNEARIRPTYLQSFMQIDMPSVAESGDRLGDGVGLIEEALSDAATMMGFYKEILWWGDGTGKLATVSGAQSNVTEITVDDIPGTLYLRPGMIVDVIQTDDSTEDITGAATPTGLISAVDEANNTFTVNTADTVTDGASVSIYDTLNAVFDGVRKLVDDGTIASTVMNIDTTAAAGSFFKSRVIDAGAQTLTLDLLERAYNIVERQSKNPRQTLQVWSNPAQQTELFLLNAAQRRYNDVDITAGPPKGGVKYTPGKAWKTALYARPDEIFILNWNDLLKKTVQKTGVSQWPSGGGWQRTASTAAIENFMWSGECTGIVNRKRSLKIKNLAAPNWN
jgi:hypothetical protein